MWWCTGGRQTTSARWRCWRTDACKPRCRTACRLLSHHRRCSRRDRWSRYPCQRSGGEEWNLEHEGMGDRQEVKGAKTYQLEIRFALYPHRQCGEFDFIWGDSSVTRQICRVTEDITWTQRAETQSCCAAADADAGADVKVGEVKILKWSPISLRSRNRTPRA